MDDWKDDIRKTIYRQLPKEQKETLDFEDAYSLRKKTQQDSKSLWERTTAALIETMKGKSFTDKDADSKADEQSDSETAGMNDKEWLFHESLRLEALRKDVSKAGKLLQEEAARLKEDTKKLEEERKQFEKEKDDFRKEIKEQTKKNEEQRFRLEEEKKLFDKKYKVLEMGFSKLNEDKKAFESQKRAFEYRKKFLFEAEEFASFDSGAGRISGDFVFFKGVSHPLAVKKRYKDLIKIYHPDNMDGDKYILQRINQEYDRIRKMM
ncbi:MAG: hypothetical protein K5739_06710 [Lachnospiraceae bacterium]|nr:hypothetical protein [Lachnospiraceae bacterium]